MLLCSSRWHPASNVLDADGQSALKAFDAAVKGRGPNPKGEIWASREWIGKHRS